MKTIVSVLALGMIVLGGCHKTAPADRGPVKRTEPVAVATDYLARINALPDRARNAVFFRALSDANLDCGTVKSSEPRAPVQGYPAWVAHCDRRVDWVLVLEKDGMIQAVTPAQLSGGSKPAPTQAGKSEGPK
ncbi:MAG: hypothetical protein V4459_07060 [Pseudomonadota bacterium]